MSSRKPPPLRLAAVALALGGLFPLAATAAEQMILVRDAETGQLRAPTAAEAAALQTRATPAPSSATIGAKVSNEQRALRHGAVALELDASNHMFSVARRNDDGTIDRACIQGESAAQQAASKPTPAFTRKPVLTAPRTARGEAYELQ